MSLSQAADLLAQLERRRSTHRLEYYKPYPFQQRFHESPARIRVLMAANQIGKTLGAGAEVAMHLTGRYPEDWRGHRFPRPIEGCVGSNTNETARDICQKELFGPPDNDKALGTGAIPIDCIGKITRKAGVPNAMDSVTVRHVGGGFSRVAFRAYEQGAKKWMGHRYHLVWADEEPPGEVWSQMLRATFSTNGRIMMTFTPEEGMTLLVSSLIDTPPDGVEVIQAGWDDAPHMNDGRRAELLAQIPEHERDMRTKGVPLMGSGRVFTFPEGDLKVEPFDMPLHWPRLCATDFGYDHPFAAVWMAWDRDTDTVYVYDAYRISKALIPIHASAIKARGDWIPVVWPHDGLQHDPKAGKPLADLYREEGVNMRPAHFTNPPSPGQKEGEGGNSVEAGIEAMKTRMAQGRFKVFRHLNDWFSEYRMYHRHDGKLVKLQDDLMSATRYGHQSLRHAYTRPVPVKRVVVAGMRNW